MKDMRPDNVDLIRKKRLCSGCGSCAAICRKSCIVMMRGIRYNYPRIDEALCNHCGLCLKVCPGGKLLDRLASRDRMSARMTKTLSCHVAFSNSDRIRFNAASGGFITSLVLFLMEQRVIDGAICAKQDDDGPLESRSFIALSEADVLNASGSRYSPVSGCENLKKILADDKSYAFIGKPCEIEGLNEMLKVLPGLQEKIKLRISLMCAGTPSRKGTRKLLRKLRIEPSKVKALSYRGNGWPGYFTAKMKDGGEVRLPYPEAWNHCLSKYSCVRCILCDDPLGDGADITVGDAWDQKYLPIGGGLSAVVVRTETGRKYMDMAIGSHVISAEEVSEEDIRRFQRALLRKTEKMAGYIFAYRFVFLGRPELCSLHRQPGGLKAHVGLFKRVLRFIIYRISHKYY